MYLASLVFVELPLAKFIKVDKNVCTQALVAHDSDVSHDSILSIHDSTMYVLCWQLLLAYTCILDYTAMCVCAKCWKGCVNSVMLSNTLTDKPGRLSKRSRLSST